MGRLLVSGGSIIRKYGYILRYLYLCFQVCIPALRGNKKGGRGRGGGGGGGVESRSANFN